MKTRTRMRKRKRTKTRTRIRTRITMLTGLKMWNKRKTIDSKYFWHTIIIIKKKILLECPDDVCLLLDAESVCVSSRHMYILSYYDTI